MKTTIAVLVCIFAAMVPVVARADFTVLQTTQERRGPFATTTYVVQNGPDALNRFGVERVTLASLARYLLQPVVLEPSLGNNAAEYTIGDVGPDFQNSVAASLASAALDVYLYSPREAFLTPGQCSAAGSCQEAAAWGLDAAVDDLAFIQDLISHQDPHKKAAIGGYSLGGITAISAVNRDPSAFSGLMLMDSPVVASGPLAGAYGTLCQGALVAIAAGQVLDATLDPLAQLLVQLNLQAPGEPSPVPIFPPGTTNRQAYLGFFSGPQPGPPASIFPPGFQLVTGTGTGFAIADEGRLNSQVESFNFYIPTAIFADVECALAGVDHFSNLGAFRGPVLNLEFENGFGKLDEETLPLFSASRDIDSMVYLGFGHVDTLLSLASSRRPIFDDVLIGWIYGDVVFGL